MKTEQKAVKVNTVKFIFNENEKVLIEELLNSNESFEIIKENYKDGVLTIKNELICPLWDFLEEEYKKLEMNDTRMLIIDIVNQFSFAVQHDKPDGPGIG